MRCTASTVRSVFTLLIAAASVPPAAADCEPGAPPEACPPKFILGFDGIPEVVRGLPGQSRTLEAFVTLTSENVFFPDGVQGWSLSVVAEGENVLELLPTLKGVNVSTIFDHDGDDPDSDGLTELGAPATPLVDPADLDLANAGFRGTHVGFSGIDPRVGDPRFHGAGAAVVLHMWKKMVLQPKGTQRVCKLTFQVTFPAEPVCRAVKLTFEDGVGYAGPIRNVITFQGMSRLPETRSTTFLVCPPASFRRGDSNADGKADISDPIVTLGFLYLGDAPPLCLDAADVNNDGALDISDPVFFLDDFFISPFPFSLIPLPGPFDCGPDPASSPPDALSCDSFPSCE